MKNRFENKTTIELSFVILIIRILKFRNIGRFIFGRSKIWPPPLINFMLFLFYVKKNKNNKINVKDRKLKKI